MSDTIRPPFPVLEMLTAHSLTSVATVVVIDIVMSGDNAIVIGMAAAGLPAEHRRSAICVGVIAATVLRIAFALVTFHLLAVIGLTLAGGLLLLWVCWKLWRDIRLGQISPPALAEPLGTAMGDGPPSRAGKPKSLRQAIVAIVVADVSMSLDNVLAVAGAARDHFWVLVFGLMLSIALMAVASAYIARLLDRHHWIAYVGLAIVTYVALDMIYRGTLEIATVAAVV